MVVWKIFRYLSYLVHCWLVNKSCRETSKRFLDTRQMICKHFYKIESIFFKLTLLGQEQYVDFVLLTNQPMSCWKMSTISRLDNNCNNYSITKFCFILQLCSAFSIARHWQRTAIKYVSQSLEQFESVLLLYNVVTLHFS